MNPDKPPPEPPPGDATDEDACPGESLGQSFRQARREMWVMLGAWVVFFLWVTIACARSAFAAPGAMEGSVPLLFGIPRWVAMGVAVPWLAANAFIIWFALGFMKDTVLPGEKVDAATADDPSDS